jgi:uncharacterized membrane protein YfcA
MNPITALLVSLFAVTGVFAAAWTRAIARTRSDAGGGSPTPVNIGIGALTNFFDTLGIGSFATTTALFRLGKLVNDRIIPGTLNIGHTFPTTAQAVIFTTTVEVDVLTLISMIAASTAGAWLGAGIVAGWSKKKVQIGMGAALLVAAALMFMTQLQLFPLGGEALGVRGARLVIAVIANFMLGALMTLGIGLYAPCMILVSLLGMNPRAAFPIMMGSCAFLMPVGSLRFIREKCYHSGAALGLAIGGIPAVLLAAYIVKELPLWAVRWLVIAVVVYTATTLLRAAAVEKTMAPEASQVAGD